jgi:hypothetical protein
MSFQTNAKPWYFCFKTSVLEVKLIDFSIQVFLKMTILGESLYTFPPVKYFCSYFWCTVLTSVELLFQDVYAGVTESILYFLISIYCWNKKTELSKLLKCVWPTHAQVLFCQSKLHYDRQSVGQSVLVSGALLGPTTNL